MIMEGMAVTEDLVVMEDMEVMEAMAATADMEEVMDMVAMDMVAMEVTMEAMVVMERDTEDTAAMVGTDIMTSKNFCVFLHSIIFFQNIHA